MSINKLDHTKASKKIGTDFLKLVKENRLKTRMSASDSNNTQHNIGLVDQPALELSASNAELEADLEAAQSSMHTLHKLPSSKPKSTQGNKSKQINVTPLESRKSL